MMKLKFFASLALALAAPSLAAGEKPLFASPDAIHVSLQAPLQKLIQDREFQGSIPGTLTEPSGQALPIALSLRGHVNRTHDVCEFPPLRVQFTAPPPATSAFAGQKKLKLVTHCRNNPSNQQYILLDYSAYRMYNLLTPHSFRVRLADVDYRGADGRPIIARLGFFIEDEGDVAKRNGMREVKAADRIPVEYLSAADAARYALFEHMIANHDWSMRAGPPGEACCHNAKLIGLPSTGATIPVPYDFDFSGLVNAPYATPPAELDISDVRQRVYRGYCIYNADVVAAARQLRAEHQQILGVLSAIPELEPSTRQRAASFLEKFFADIGSDADVGAKVINRCVG